MCFALWYMTSIFRDANYRGCCRQSCGEFGNVVIDFRLEWSVARVVDLECSYVNCLFSYDKYVPCGLRAST